MDVVHSSTWSARVTALVVSILNFGHLMYLFRDDKSITGRHFPFFLGTKKILL